MLPSLKRTATAPTALRDKVPSASTNRPVRTPDDFIALMGGGKIYGTENGCFAKTFGLDPKHEPTIYGAVTKRDAYLENVSQKEDGGPVDFFDTSYTQNGRATFELSALGWVEDARNIGTGQPHGAGPLVSRSACAS